MMCFHDNRAVYAAGNIVSDDEAVETLLGWLKKNSYYPVPFSCIEHKDLNYANRGYTITLGAKGCPPYTPGVFIGRWRVDAVTRDIYVQNEKGKYVVPDVKKRPALPTVDTKRCLEYEPKVVQLSGYLMEMTFAGPPEYYSIEKGDGSEVSWFIHLDKPACTQGTPGDDTDESKAPIAEIQLVLEPKQYGKWKSLVGKSVIAKGKLFGSHTGHHHTDVLLDVDDLSLQGH